MARKAFLLLALALLAALAGVGPSGATDWDVYYVPHYPMSVALPASWDPLGLTGSDVFNAGNDSTGSYLQVFTYPHAGTQAKFFAGLPATARSTYLEQDPKAVVRVRSVSFPAGMAIEVIAQVTRVIGGKNYAEWLQNYNFFYHGVGYDVDYSAPPSALSVDLPVFAASVGTIRFGGGPAVLPSSGPA